MALNDSSPWVRYYAVKSLVFHNPPNVLEMLEELLKREETALVKIIIIESLGELQNKKALPLLKNFLETQDRDLLSATIRAVGKIRHPEAINLLIPFLSSPDKHIKIETLRSLANLKDNAVINNIVWSIATKDSPEVITEGLNSLLTIGTLESVKVILSLSLDSNKRELCMKTLSLIPEEFISPLLSEAKHTNPILRINLIFALEMRKRDVSKYLREFLKDENREIRLQAISSLIDIGSYEAKKILMEYLEKEEDSEIKNLLIQKLERNNL